MITLEIGNSTCKISGLDRFQHKELREILSYEIDPQAAYFSGSHRNTKRYLLDNKGNFPTGLLYLVDKWQIDTGLYAIKEIDTRKQPKPSIQAVFKKSFGVYEDQVAAVRAAKEKHRGIISMPTGSGKSVVAALIIDAFKVRTLVVVPSLELKRQLTETFKALFTGVEVGRLGCPIAVENVDALDPNKEIDYDCIIIDEFHHSGAKTYQKLNKKAWATVYHRFGITATAFRSNENERLLLESILSKVIYRLDYPTAVKKGYVVPLEAYYIDVERKLVGEAYTWADVYSRLIVRNLGRNELIAKLMLKIKQTGAFALTLVKEIAHGEALSALLVGYNISFVKGENVDNKILIDGFNKGRHKSLIGTTGVLGEGIDTKPCEYVIIAGLGKAKGQFMQSIGRALRVYPGKESAKVILFRDASHKYTLRHFNAQVKILKEEYSVKPVKIKVQ